MNIQFDCIGNGTWLIGFLERYSWRCQVSVSEVIILEVPGEGEWGHYTGGARWVWVRSLFWRCQVSEWGQYPGGARWVGGHYSWRCQVSVSEAPGGECEVTTPGGARWVWARSLLLEVPGECEWGSWKWMWVWGHYSWRCQVSVSKVITPGGARWV